MEAASALSFRAHMDTDSRSDSMDTINSNPNIPDYFRSSTDKEAEKKESHLIIQNIHSKFSDVFTGIGCFKGTFKLQVRGGSHTYQASPRRAAYVLQESLMEELKWLEKQQVIVPLDVDETLEWYSIFVLVPKENTNLLLWLDQTRLNKVLINPVYRVPTLNDILPTPDCIKYLKLIEAIIIYHLLSYYHLKLDYNLHTELPLFFIWQVQIFPFGIAPAGGMFKIKVDELFHGISNAICIADDIPIAGINELGRYHDATLDKVLGICRGSTWRFNEDKCLFWCTSIPYFGEIVLHFGVSPDPRKVQALTNLPPARSKKELQSFLGILNYLCKFSPKGAEVCKLLWKLILEQAEWLWNRMN